MPKQILRLPEVIRQTGIKRSTIYDLIARGKFPRPIHLSTRSRGFLADEVDAWITARVSESPRRFGLDTSAGSDLSAYQQGGR